MSDAVFIREGEFFHPQPNAGSPWGPATLHGAAPAGLIGHALEQLLPSPEMQLARMTIDLFRPVPMAPLRLSSEVVRAGRKIHVVQVSLWADAVEVCRASGVMLRRTPIDLPANLLPAADKPAGPEGLVITGIRDAAAGESAFALLPGFHTAIEVKRVSGGKGQGAGCAWLRIPIPLIDGLETTPLMRVTALSDLGNGIGQLQAEDVGFINTDISLNLHRLPQGEWICIDARTLAQPCGIGMVETVLYDHLGPIGRVTQANLANPLYRG